MSLGQIIRKRRQELNLTLDTVSSEVGFSKPYLSNIETGKTRNPPTDGVLMSLERSLGMPADRLTRLAHLTRTPSDVRAEYEALRAEVRQLRGWLGGFLAAVNASLGRVRLNVYTRGYDASTRPWPWR